MILFALDTLSGHHTEEVPYAKTHLKSCNAGKPFVKKHKASATFGFIFDSFFSSL